MAWALTVTDMEIERIIPREIPDHPIFVVDLDLITRCCCGCRAAAPAGMMSFNTDNSELCTALGQQLAFSRMLGWLGRETA